MSDSPRILEPEDVHQYTKGHYNDEDPNVGTESLPTRIGDGRDFDSQGIERKSQYCVCKLQPDRLSAVNRLSSGVGLTKGSNDLGFHAVLILVAASDKRHAPLR